MTVNRGIMSNIEIRSPGGRAIIIIFAIVLIITSIIFLFPFFFAFSAGLKTSTEIFKPGLNLFPEVANWKNYVEAWQRFKMPRMFLVTFNIALGGVFGRLLVSSLAAYSISRLKPAGKSIIQSLLLVTLTIPMIAYLIPLYKTLTDVPLIHVNLVNKFWGLWLPYSASAFYILVLKNSFDQIPPDLFDAAAVDGASQMRMFISIVLPLSAPILLVLGLLTFVGIWGDFLLPYLVLRDPNLQTVSVRLYNLTRIFPYNLQMAGAFFGMLPPAIAVLLFQRYMRGGLSF